MQILFLHQGCLPRQSGCSSRCIHTTQTSYPCDLPVSTGDRLLHRNIWEAFYHRLGVLVLGMLLETEVAQKNVLDMSRPVGRKYDNARWCPGRHQLQQGYLDLLQGKETRKKLTKDCLQTEQMIFLAISFDLAWLLVAFGAFWALRSRFCWALAPCMQSAPGNT
jgi:hypothetical protein